MANERLIIALTSRRPVSIDQEEWPRIAYASGDSWDGGPDYARHRQASLDGQLTEYFVGARRHNSNGQVIVYAKYTASCCRNGDYDRSRGVILKKPSDDVLISAIREVGESCDIPRHIIDDCIADLKPEEI